MTGTVKVGFTPLSAAVRGVLVVFADKSLSFGPAARKVLGEALATVKRAATAAKFDGKRSSGLEILAPQGLNVDRLLVIGTGDQAKLTDEDFLKLGGAAAGRLKSGGAAVTILAELANGPMSPRQASAVAAGARLRS